MDVPADQSSPKSASRSRTSTRILWSPRRRRPTGEPPPLPYHLQTSGVGWLIAVVVLVALAAAVFGGGLRGVAVEVTVADAAVVSWLAGIHAPGMMGVSRALAAISSWWVLNGLVVGLLLALLVLRRVRHLIILVIAVQLLGGAANVMGSVAQRPRPFGVVIRADWASWALPSLQVTFFAAGLIAILYTLVPEGRWRNTGKWLAAGLVTLTALGRVALGADAPTDVLVAAAIGVTLPLLAFRRFAPNEAFPVRYRRGRSAHLDVGGARGEAIRRAVQDQLGVVVLDVEPFGQQFSASSTPLRIAAQGDQGATYLFAKLYATGHLRADRWYKLGRELVYGRLEDEKPFNSVRRLVEHEDYALRLLRDAGLPVPKPFGSVELTPEREYLLVTEFLEGAKEISEAEVDDAIIDEGLAIVRGLWDAGLAHRDIKPANLLVQAGHVRLIDTFLTEVHASPWRQAMDLANMMLVLGLRADPARVYQRAKQLFTDVEIGEAFAARQGRAMPSQVRQLLSARSVDLPTEFVGLLPSPPRPIRIQRWTVRRVGLWALVAALLAYVGVTIVGNVTLSAGDETPLSFTNLGCTRMEPLWLEAQSVPSASLVPCVRSLPAGWTLSEVVVNHGRSVLTFDNDRAGPGVMVVRLAASCDPAGATQVPSNQPGARRFVQVQDLAPQYSATGFYVFPGGCVTARLAIPAARQAQLVSEASAVLGFTTRRTLQQTLEARSGGRLHLDPDTAR